MNVPLNQSGAMKWHIKMIYQRILEVIDNIDPENQSLHYGQPINGLAFCNSPPDDLPPVYCI
jgi:hypothetical protein